MHEQIKLEGTDVEKIVSLIRAAGGSLTGRTRLQKTIYVLELAGFLEGFEFEYRHYGPYSEDLSQATLFARMSGALVEEERRATWGGTYSIFRSPGERPKIAPNMQAMINIAVNSNPIALELAATAAFLALEGCKKPWEETSQRKADKAQYIESAKDVYAALSKISSPRPLPAVGS